MRGSQKWNNYYWSKYNNCLWCARKGGCPANLRLVIRANHKYQDVEVPAVLNELRLETPEQFGAFLKKNNELFAKTIRDYKIQ